MKVLIMSDMEGVSGIVVWSQVNGRPHVRGGATPIHGDQRCRAWRQECRCWRDRRRRLPRSQGDWSFNSLVPELLDEGCWGSPLCRSVNQMPGPAAAW